MKKEPKFDTFQSSLIAALAIYCSALTESTLNATIILVLGIVFAAIALLHIGMYWLPGTKSALARLRDYVERHNETIQLLVFVDLYFAALAAVFYALIRPEIPTVSLHTPLIVIGAFIALVNIVVIYGWWKERKDARIGRFMTVIAILALPFLNSCQSCSPSGVRQQQFERETRRKAMEKADERVFFTVTDFVWGFPLNLPTKRETITIQAQTYDFFGENAAKKEARFDLVVIAGERSLKDLEADLRQGPKAIFYLDRKDIKKSVRMPSPERDCSVMFAEDIHRMAVSKDTILIPTLISR